MTLEIVLLVILVLAAVATVMMPRVIWAAVGLAPRQRPEAAPALLRSAPSGGMGRAPGVRGPTASRLPATLRPS